MENELYFKRVSDGKYFESYKEDLVLRVSAEPVAHEVTPHLSREVVNGLEYITKEKWVRVDPVTLIEF